MLDTTLRELTGADWRDLRELRLEALRSAPGMFFRSFENELALSDERWQAYATGDDVHQSFGAFDGDRLIAISGVFPDPADPSGATLVFGMSYVKPPYRGRGIVTRFYDLRLAWAYAHPHFTRAIVGHRLSNEPSRRAMERAGFVLVGEEMRPWPDGAHALYRSYALPLQPQQPHGA